MPAFAAEYSIDTFVANICRFFHKLVDAGR